LLLKNGTFDIIWASHILEHVKDDIKAIQEITRVLKKGGIAVLPVPVNR
jgi:ubiquinone/menaquinone biosynthesis C-methylase UbiE